MRRNDRPTAYNRGNERLNDQGARYGGKHLAFGNADGKRERCFQLRKNIEQQPIADDLAQTEQMKWHAC